MRSLLSPPRALFHCTSHTRPAGFSRFQTVSWVMKLEQVCALWIANYKMAMATAELSQIRARLLRPRAVECGLWSHMRVSLD
eukprot:6937436-Prymnesium_polylepis.1